MKADPPVRRDGKCVVCLGERKVPKGKWARAEAAKDPWCSSTCCRIWHETELPVGHPGVRVS